MTMVSKMITSRENAVCIQLSGARRHQCLVIGGNDSFRNLSSVECFDMKTQKWSLDSTLPAARAFPTVAIDPTTGPVYQFGGMIGSEFVTTCDWYNPLTRAWTVLSSKMNIGRAGAAAIYIPHMKGFIIIGGVSSSDNPNFTPPFTSAEFYSPATNTFIFLPNFSPSNMNHSLQLIDQRILVLTSLYILENHHAAGYMMDITKYDTIKQLISSLPFSSTTTSAPLPWPLSSYASSAATVAVVPSLVWSSLPPFNHHHTMAVMRSMILNV